MIQKLSSIVLLTLITVPQMNSIAPDVSYTANNDRYDLSEMMRAHNKMFRDTPLVDDDDDGGKDSRRNMRDEAPEKSYEIINPQFLKNVDLPRIVLTRRDDVDVAFDPDYLSRIDGASISQVNAEHHPYDVHLTRRVDGSFAEDDSKNSYEGGTVSDFEENLKKFRVNKSRRRRSLDGDEFIEDFRRLKNPLPWLPIM